MVIYTLGMMGRTRKSHAPYQEGARMLRGRWSIYRRDAEMTKDPSQESADAQ